MEIAATLAIALVTGMASGLTAWGALKVEMRYIRRDVDDHHERITRLERLVHGND